MVIDCGSEPYVRPGAFRGAVSVLECDHATIDPPPFVVERLVVRFRDWRSSYEAFRGLMLDVIATKARQQLEELTRKQRCNVLAIDASDVDRLPSAFLGVLIALSKSGLQIELLHLSPSVRQSLKVTKLERFFTIRD
jgi:anti-anti-sigma factor